VAGAGAGAAVVVNLPETFNSGSITFIDYVGATTGGADALLMNLQDGVLATYTAAVGSDSTKLDITAVKKSASTIATALGVTAEAAGALDSGVTALAGASTAQDVATQIALQNVLVAGGAAATEAAKQMQGSPGTMTAAGSAAVSATGTQVIAVGSTRLASLRSGPQFASSQASGFNAGSGELAKALWMKPFVNFGDQDLRKGIAGYETDTYGLAMGADVKVGRSTYGLSFSYADTDVDSKGAGNAQTDISSYQATFYTDYTTDKWYVEGLVGYARNEIDTSRSITVNTLTAEAEYGSNQFMINIGGGIPLEIAKNHFITPNASFQYTLVDNETYTESGAGGLNLRVDQDEVNIALGVFGARYHAHNDMGSGTLTPEIRGSLTYDFAGDDGQSTSLANGGGAAFGVTGADVVELGYRAGLGLSYAPNDNGLTVSANYDLNQKTDFIGHSANFSLRYEF
jgi:uncharacterized protein with beta-barrel porin domain